MISLERMLDNFKISYNNDMLNQFMSYYELLVEWNQKVNLTTIVEYEEVIKKHFLDSLSLVKVLPDLVEGKYYKVIDIGTGAGFPGVPLKICFPQLDITLMDSLNKRVSFLNHVIYNLDLEDIHVVHARAEEMGRRNDYREIFDLCVSRAVARMVSLSEYCFPFVKVGGYFIPYKSGKILEELEEATQAIKVLGGKVLKVEKFILPETDMERSLIIVEKIKHTPRLYPRVSGKPLKAPIF